MRGMARRTDRKHVIKDGMVPLPSLTRFRSFACLERHELGIISGSGNALSLCSAAVETCGHQTSNSKGSMRLETSRVSPATPITGHSARGPNLVADPLNLARARGIGSQRLGRPTWCWQLRPSSEPTFEPRRQKDKQIIAAPSW